MAYWLVKTEPSCWSWGDQVKHHRTHWDGVRNYQASNNLKSMTIGDYAFFYHSNVGKEIVGIVEVVRLYYPDPTDETHRFGMVDFAAVCPLIRPIPLTLMKDHPGLENLPLIRQSRLSVMPIQPDEWSLICDLSGTPWPQKMGAAAL